MPSLTRAQRLAERIREVLAELLLRETSDPRLSSVSVTEVRVDREFAHASIYVSVLDADLTRRGEVMRALQGARGFLRHELAVRIPIRTFPQLRFIWDDLPDRAEHLQTLLDAIGPHSNQAGGVKDNSKNG
ncbi:MAG: 30S ribosome-binding factor RbfA [Anaerolineales bacterium]|jgi:ribosome-binding factor A